MRMRVNRFEQHVYETVRAALDEIDAADMPEIYALSFFLQDGEERAPAMWFGYNTHTQARSSTPAQGEAAGWPIASDIGEATWNYAFWLQNTLAFVGEPGSHGQGVLIEVMREEGLWYTEEEAAADPDRCMRLDDRMHERFADMCATAARALHANGVIAARFGKTIPIVVHELDYYDRIVDLTQAANPSGIAARFVDWVRSL